jgi:CBS domain containing-hemolysin-like protein
MWIGLLWRVGVVCLVLPPVFLFVVYGVPRLLLRQEGMESDDDIPRWLRPFLGMVRSLRVLSRVFYLLPFGGLFQHHQLTKSDLLALVTDLEWEDDDEEPEAEPATEASEGLNEEEEEETDEEEIIYNILDLEETLVREVMKPINSVVAIRLGRNSAEDVKELAARTGYSRFPVYRDRIVDLVGYVSIYDILRNENPNRPLESFLTPAYFVPEFMKLNTLLAEFLRRGERVAIVVDEYGGSSGWVTREDVLEEIVGEIEDEFDTRAKGLRELENGEYLAEGAMNVDDFTEETGLTFEESRQYDTLAGFILMRLQRMPREGDRVETEEAVYEVTRMEMNRVAEIKATPKPRPL